MSYPDDGGPCVRRYCTGGRYRLVAVLGRSRVYRCPVCGDEMTYAALPGGEPMPSERGMPACELADDAPGWPGAPLVERVRRIRDHP